MLTLFWTDNYLSWPDIGPQYVPQRQCLVFSLISTRTSRFTMWIHPLSSYCSSRSIHLFVSCVPSWNALPESVAGLSFTLAYKCSFKEVRGHLLSSFLCHVLLFLFWPCQSSLSCCSCCIKVGFIPLYSYNLRTVATSNCWVGLNWTLNLWYTHSRSCHRGWSTPQSWFLLLFRGGGSNWGSGLCEAAISKLHHNRVCPRDSNL
jgi:hypothetical protein